MFPLKILKVLILDDFGGAQPIFRQTNKLHDCFEKNEQFLIVQYSCPRLAALKVYIPTSPLTISLHQPCNNRFSAWSHHHIVPQARGLDAVTRHRCPEDATGPNPSFGKFLLQLKYLKSAKDQLSLFHKVATRCTRCTDYSNSFAQSPLAPQLNISNINSFPRPLWVTYFGRLLAAACRHHRPAGWFGRDGRWATRLGVLGATGTHGTCHWSFQPPQLIAMPVICGIFQGISQRPLLQAVDHLG